MADSTTTRKSFSDWSLLAMSDWGRSSSPVPRKYLAALPDTWSAPKREPHFLEALFGSQSRARALVVLIAGRGEEVHLTELARKAGTTAPTLRKSLAPLLAVGILRQRTEGNRLYLAANQGHPAYRGIADLVAAAVTEVMKKARTSQPNAAGAGAVGHQGE